MQIHYRNNGNKRSFMGIHTHIANVWKFGLRLTNTAFKPALGELYCTKSTVCTKFAYRLFHIQNRFFFWGGGTTPVWKGHPSTHTLAHRTCLPSLFSEPGAPTIWFPHFFRKRFLLDPYLETKWQTSVPLCILTLKSDIWWHRFYQCS